MAFTQGQLLLLRYLTTPLSIGDLHTMGKTARLAAIKVPMMVPTTSTPVVVLVLSPAPSPPSKFVHFVAISYSTRVH
jgi:hypothetical protein